MEKSPPQLNFTGQVALITGGASGIGRAVAEQLAELGASIAVADANIEGADAVAAELTNRGAAAIAIKVDVSKPDEANEMVARAVARFGKVDILVHSAVSVSRNPFSKQHPRSGSG